MKIETSALEDVVVTGYANIDKKSFTGNAVSVEQRGITESFQVKRDSSITGF